MKATVCLSENDPVIDERPSRIRSKPVATIELLAVGEQGPYAIEQSDDHGSDLWNIKPVVV